MSKTELLLMDNGKRLSLTTGNRRGEIVENMKNSGDK
jgi:hypothetical protein